MRKLIICFLPLLIIASCKDAATKPPTTETHSMSGEHQMTQPSTSTNLSPHTSVMEMIGEAHIHIDYSSPGVRGRMIFGGLLPYDAVWQAGAHRATWFETNKELIVAGKELKAGKYGFFVIPTRKEWTVIFNDHWDQHGKDEYDEQRDVLRFKVIPQTLAESEEHLTYSITKANETAGTVTMAWDTTAITFPITVK